MRRYAEKGFTLIELLIVITIIGLLAGVLISVIDITGTQNKTNDAKVKATINKSAMATEGFISAYGRVPNGAEFLAGLQNATDSAATCVATGQVCSFTVSGNGLDAVCAADGFTNSAAGAAQCYYRYDGGVGGAGDTDFTITAASYGIPATNFTYDNTVGTIAEVTN